MCHRQCGKIQDKVMKINTPKEQGHHGVSQFLPTCSIYSLGPCAISSTQLLSRVSPRGAVPDRAISHCHSSAFMLPLCFSCSKLLFKHYQLHDPTVMKKTKKCYNFQQPESWHISSYKKKSGHSLICTDDFPWAKKCDYFKADLYF